MRSLIFAVVVSLWGVAAPAWAAEDVLGPTVRSELKLTTEQLGELMRFDVEEIIVDTDHVVSVPLTNTTLGNVVYKSRGAIVPLIIEGVSGGNALQYFVALFEVIDPDEERLRDFGHADNPHKHVALLAFTQLDNRGPAMPDWTRVRVTLGMIKVPVQFHNCNGRHGTMTLRVNGNWVGPRITVAFDAGATLLPGACLRKWP